MLRVLAFFIGAVLLASGCDDRTPATSGQPAPVVSTSTTKLSISNVVQVLRTDGATLHTDWLLFGAQQRAVAACMHRHGFEYEVNSGGKEPGLGAATAEVRASTYPPTYGIAAQMSAFLPGSIAANSAVTAQDAYVRRLSPDRAASYSLALDGPADATAVLTLPSGRQMNYETQGCLAEARQKVFGSTREALLDALLPSDVDNSFFATLANDEHFRLALDGWRTCMRRARHPAKNPAALINGLRQMLANGVDPGVVAVREQAAAAADMSCDSRSNLRAVESHLLAAYVRKLPADVRDALSAVAERRRAALASVRT